MATATLGEAIFRIGANTRAFSAGLGQASKMLDTLSSQAQSFASSLSAAGRTALGFSAAISAALAPAILVGSSFEKQMAAVKSVMGDLNDGTVTASQRFEALSEVVKNLGATTQFTATQVGEAAEFLALAGFNANETMQALPGTLNLAAAGALDLGRASDIASDTLTAFKLEAADLDRVVDVMAQTAANANTTVELMGTSMQYVAPTAATLGQSIEEVSAAIGVLGNSGIKGSTAGTGLSQVFQQLAKKGEKVTEILRKYGLTFEDVNPEVVSLRQIIAQFEAVNLSAGDAMEIFGARAGRSLLALKNSGVRAFDELNQKIEMAAGSAEKMANIRMDTTIGDFTRLRSALEGLGISIFEAFSKSLRGLIANVTNIVDRINAWAKENQQLVGTIVGVLGTLAGFLTAIGAALVVAGTFIGAIAGIVVIGAKLIAVVAAISAGVGLAAAVIGTLLLPVILAFIAKAKELYNVFRTAFQNVILPFWRQFSSTVSDLWTSLIKPAFDELAEAVGELIQVWQEFYGSTSELEPLIKAFATVLANVLVNAIWGVIKVLTLLIKFAKAASIVLTSLASVAGHLYQQVGQALGIVQKTVDLEKGVKADTQLRERATKAIREQTEALMKRMEISRSMGREDRKALSILENFGSASTLQIAQLEKLQSAGALNTEGIRERIVALEQEIETHKRVVESNSNATETQRKASQAQLEFAQEYLEKEREILKQTELFEKIIKGGVAALDAEIDTLQKSIDKRQDRIDELNEEIVLQAKMKQSSHALREELKNLQVEQDAERITLNTLNNQNKERIFLLNQLKGNLTALAAEEARRTQLREDALKAAERLEASEQRFLDLQKELNKEQKIGVAAEIQGVQELTAEYQAFMDIREQDFNLRKSELEIRIRQIEAYQDEELKIRDLARAKEDLASVERGLADISETRDKLRAREIKDIEILRIKAAESRKELLMDQEIERLRREGKEIAAVKLENQKILAEKKKLFNDIFALDGKNNVRIMEERKKAEENLRKELADRLREAADKQDGKDPIIAAAERERTLEEKITSQLTSQVRSLVDMLLLYRAIAAVRQEQEARAQQAADKAVRMRQFIEDLEKKREARMAKGGEEALLGKIIERNRKQLELLEAIEGKRAAEAGLGDPAGKAAIGVGGKVRDQLLEIQRAIAELRGAIEHELTFIADLFVAAPINWANLFVETWRATAPRMVDEVRATMDQIKVAMEPTTRSSPSLIDVWKMNVVAVKKGVGELQKAIEFNRPNLTSLKAVQAITAYQRGVTGSAGGFQRPVAREFNDNRKVTMDIHSNVDIENVKRQIGRALVTSKMGKAVEI